MERRGWRAGGRRTGGTASGRVTQSALLCPSQGPIAATGARVAGWRVTGLAQPVVEGRQGRTTVPSNKCIALACCIFNKEVLGLLRVRVLGIKVVIIREGLLFVAENTSERFLLYKQN